MLIGDNLLNDCKKQDRRAQHELYKSCFPHLFKVAIRYSNNKDDALTLLNNAFLKILTNLDKYKNEIPFIVWAKKVVINTVIDEYRKNKKYAEQHQLTDWSDEQEQNFYVNPERADKKFDLDDILKMVNGLSPATRSVFNLYVIDGYSHKEIAELLSISEGTSKWHLSEARKILVRKIESGILNLLLII